MTLTSYNEPAKDHEEIMYPKCDNVIDCLLAAEVDKECGTSQYRTCSLKESAINTYVKGIVVYNEFIS